MNKIRLEIYNGSSPRLVVASRRNGGYRVCGDKLYGYVTPNVTFEVDAEMLIDLIKQYMFDENDWSEDKSKRHIKTVCKSCGRNIEYDVENGYLPTLCYECREPIDWSGL